jgi:hypothetical protein
VLLLALVVLASFGLRIREYRVGLPHVFHSDYVQVEQAARLVRDGSFRDTTIYPATQVFAYAAADWVAYGLGRLTGTWPDFGTFADELQGRSLQHAIGRAYTAVVGSLLGIAVYLLARLRFSRGVAVLAAAMVSFGPVHVIYSHQVRPHIACVTLVAFAAIPVLRLTTAAATARGALLAGLATGVAAAFFQLGWVLLATAAVLIACFTRPWGRALRLGLLGLLGFGVGLGTLMALCRWPGLVVAAQGSAVIGQSFTDTLGFGVQDLLDDAGRFGRLALAWVAAEPARAVLLLLFVPLALRSRRHRRDLVIYGVYPLGVLAALGGLMGAQVRYTLSMTVFLAILAAAGVLALRSRTARVTCAALLVLAPLASSVRYDLLIGGVDTRLAVAELLPRLVSPEVKISIDDKLVFDPRKLPEGVARFPPQGNFRPWYNEGVPPRRTLIESAVDIHVRVHGPWRNSAIGDEAMGWFGFELYGLVDSAPPGRSFLPDAPSHIVPDLWRTTRPGPPIEFWTRTEAGRARLAAVVSPEELSTLGL